MTAAGHVEGGQGPVLAVRAEGGTGRGAGHLARGLALAQAWVRRGGRCTLVCSDVAEPWATRYAAAGVSIVAPGTPIHAGWWVVDGYDLDDEDRPDGAHLARIDDHGLSPDGPVDVLLDQNLGATAEPYAGRAGDLLLGTRYALLRQEFVDAVPVPVRSDREAGAPLHLLVAMGGSPSASVSRQVDATVALLAADRFVIEVLRGDVDPVPAMVAADLALATCGSTAWELCLLAIPTVFVSVAANQEPLGAALAARGAGRYVGRLAEVAPSDLAATVHELAGAPDSRASMAEAMRVVVDGRGAGRVATRLRSALVALRPVASADVDVVYALNNEPGTRAASFNTDEIAYEDHVRWFEARWAEPTTPMYLASDPTGNPIGLVRFTIVEGVAEIGVVIAPDRRGQGWAAALISAGVHRVAADHDVERVVAAVKATNTASQRAFVDADFDPCPSEDPDVLRYDRTHVRPVHV